MLKYVRTALAATAVAALALTGCSAGSEGTDTDQGSGDAFEVVVFTASYGTPLGKSGVDAFVEGGEALGWDVTLFTTNNVDYDRLNNDVLGAISRGADAVVGAFPDPRQIAPMVNAANDAGIPIFAFDGGAEPNEDFALNLSTNQQELVDFTMAELGTAMGGFDGKEVMVLGFDPHLGIYKRSRLAVDFLEENGATVAGGEIRQILDPGTAQEEALKFVADYLQANPGGLDGVWVSWDHPALGVVQAIEEAGRDDIFVVATDGLGAAVDKVAAGGPFVAIGIQPFDEIVAQLIEAMAIYAENGTLPEQNFIEVGASLVTKENAAEFVPMERR